MRNYKPYYVRKIADEIIDREMVAGFKYMSKEIEKLNQFQEGMSWDNYGEWHIDHIRPLANYNLEDSTIIKELCHYTNLQPLWGCENISKGNKE